MTSLAERLGMRRPPSGLDTTGALTQPPKPEWERLMDEIADARARSPRADLVHESGQRAATAALVARNELGALTPVAGKWFELPATRRLPDPYGPDPVVFGSVPRVPSSSD